MSLKKNILLSCFLFLSLVQIQGQYLVSSTELGERSLSQMNARYNIPFFKNGVKYYKVVYKTPDIKGQLSLASGLVVFPDNLTKMYPMLVYQHGTASADSDVPSRLSGEAELPILYASLGYITAAPDYLGFGDSPGFHPYVHAESEASAGVDLMRATRELAKLKGIKLNEQNFITGYSQGGHAAMALHRKLELELSKEFTVTASAPMSGPYSIGGVMRSLVLAEHEYFYPAYIPNTVVSYQLAYGNIYKDLQEVFRPEYAALIEKFAKEELLLSQLNVQLIDRLKANEGKSLPIRMFQTSTLNAILTDTMHPFNVALKLNNVHNWAPKAPTRLYYCRADDQVPFMNSVEADSLMNLLGARDLAAIDVNPSANHGQCVSPAFFNAVLFFAIYQKVEELSTDVEETAMNHLHIYPNPAGNLITLGDLPFHGFLSIRDFNGRQLIKSQVSPGNNSVDISSLPSGVFLVEIKTEYWTKFEKLLVTSHR